ncbi:trans-aconitate 2-methyltransferase [Haloechinothrix sp. LS1_15]|uniref:trans-aconitate 2-methyltransferase n=1 Tax=Haloechinothrix sp. LS1_15 TaxID=2652248 RepID=UPI002943F8DC|nr:trans-aconitate 2-methyltransferase [Haloechinothrix sp. LS1_15]MDV6012110.1 trans-aconitate 2-methyltransferase [Haloechinothrix sp. LS1_15]
MWDPSAYLDYAEPRARPFHDLLARVSAAAPRRVIDLGCGPGNLTELLAKRWPRAAVEGIDSSPEMVAAARERGIDAHVADVIDWQPLDDADVVVCNAVLQWVPGHDRLLTRWVADLPEGAWLAVQVPGNFYAPSHVALRELAAEPRWAEQLQGVVLREDDAVDSPEGYASLLADAGCDVDAWSTTYVHRLTGPDPVLDWISGTALRPIKATLDATQWTRFRDELAPRLREAYPQRSDGTTWFPFRRVFVVARTTG